MEKREKFSSRLGFILISAGCAIGLGNVWRFPYITGEYGGGLFVLIYLFFLIAMGLPIVVMEFAMGRASQKSITRSYDVLEPKGTKWHVHKYFAFAGNFLLMMFYTTVAGWMLAYFVKMAKGDFVGLSTEEVGGVFGALTGNRNEMIFWMVIITVLGLLVCSFGLEKGVEKVTKPMMICLLGLMIVLIVRAVTLDGAAAGLAFYLKPDFSKMKEAGIGEVLYAAMGQSFFTLSIGIGSLSIFGSYLNKERSLTGEAISVMALDTAVALMAGFIIFPSCFAFGIDPGEGPGLVFVTLPNVFNQMMGGRIWGTLFFMFMFFAAFSTVIAVFQNIIACARDLWGWSLKKSILINGVLLLVLSLPCIFGMTDWNATCTKILGAGHDIQWLEDFIVSYNLLPIGAAIYLFFCTTRYGWGWKNFLEEANAGQGIKFPASKVYRFYLTYILPIVILVLVVMAYIPFFK